MVLPADFFDLDTLFEDAPKLRPLPGLPSTEVEFFYNPLTGEAQLGVMETPVPEGFWRGRTDLIGEWTHPEMGPMPTVLDLKTGAPSYQVYGDADQLAFFALCLRSLLQAPLIGSIVYLSKDSKRPRVHVWTDKTLDRVASIFADHEARLCILERNEEMPEPVTGKECTFCSCKAACPAWQKVGEDDES